MKILLWHTYTAICYKYSKDSLITFLMFDHFKAQLTAHVIDILDHHNILVIDIPANCTDRLQPLDVSVNKSIKQGIFSHMAFQGSLAATRCSQASRHEALSIEAIRCRVVSRCI